MLHFLGNSVIGESSCNQGEINRLRWSTFIICFITSLLTYCICSCLPRIKMVLVNFCQVRMTLTIIVFYVILTWHSMLGPVCIYKWIDNPYSFHRQYYYRYSILQWLLQLQRDIWCVYSVCVLAGCRTVLTTCLFDFYWRAYNDTGSLVQSGSFVLLNIW
jgi:hypothetical protein